MSYFIEFLSLHVRNVGCIESADLQLKDQGLVLVKGDNRDLAGSNGSGKSTLFDTLSTSLTGTAGKLRKSDGSGGISKNDLVPLWAGKKPNLEHVLRFSRGGHLYETRHYRGHHEHGTQIKIFEDGVDISTTKKIDDVQKLILEKSGLLLREWYGSIYLPDSYSQVLLTGTPKERNDYLAAHFGLDSLDTAIKVVDKWVNAIPNNDVDSLRELLATCEDQLKSLLPLTDLQAKYSDLLSSSKSVQSQLVQAQVEVRTHESARQVEQERLAHVRALDTIGYTIERVTQEVIEDIRRRIQVAKQSILTQEQHTALHQRLAQYQEGNPDDLRQQISTSQVDLQQLAVKGQQLTKRDQLQAALDSIPLVTDSKEDLQSTIQSTRKMLSMSEAKTNILVQEIKKLQVLTDKCPTCLRTISTEEVQGMIVKRQQHVDAYQESLPSLREELRGTEVSLQSLEQRIRIELELATLPAGDLLLVQQEYAQLKTRSTELTQRLESAVTRAGILQQILQLPAVVLDDIHQIPVLEHQIQVLSSARDFIVRYGAVRFSEDALIIAQQAVQDLSLQHSKLSEELALVSAQQMERQRLQSQSDTITAQITKFESEQQRLRVLKTLNVVIKDVKGKALRDCSEMVQVALPIYVKQLFPQGDVGVELSQEGDSLDFFLKKGQVQIPVRLLSSGESKRVGLAILMAFAKFGQKSSNILIADEPFKNVDAPGRKYVFDLFRDIGIPSVFITAHDQDQSRDKLYDKVLVMRMENGKSRLVEE